MFSVILSFDKPIIIMNYIKIFFLLSICIVTSETIAHSWENTPIDIDCVFEPNPGFGDELYGWLTKESIPNCQNEGFENAGLFYHSFGINPNNSFCLGVGWQTLNNGNTFYSGFVDEQVWEYINDPNATQFGYQFFWHACLGGSYEPHNTDLQRTLFCPEFHYPVAISGEFVIGIPQRQGLRCYHDVFPPEVFEQYDLEIQWDEGIYSIYFPTIIDEDDYPQQLHFEIYQGVLPAGLNFDSTTGTISGIPYFTSAGRYDNIQVSVSDCINFSDPEKCSTIYLNPFDIVINNVNLFPIANAGSDQFVNGLQTVTLQGVAYDLDIGFPVSFSWQQISGNPVTLNNPNSLNPTFAAPNLNTTVGFRLTVQDNEGAAVFDDVSIGISTVPWPPIARAGPDQTVHPGDDVILDGDYTDNDEQPNQQTMFSWSSSENFNVDSNDTSIIRFVARPTDTELTLTFSLYVDDGDPLSPADYAGSTDEVTVTVVPLDNDQVQQEVQLCSSDDSLLGTSSYDNGSNPISHSNGNKHQAEQDYVGSGPFPIRFSRFYNSLQTRIGRHGHLGRNWRHSYHRSVVVEGSNAKVYRPNGNSIPFTFDGMDWVSGSATRSYLVRRTDSGWTYTSDNGIKENYSPVGLLESITNRTGFSLKLNYEIAYGESRLQSVTDDFQNAVNFQYYDNSNQLHKLIDSANNEYVYYYAQDKLSAVNYPDQRNRTYLYENTSFPFALTGIKAGDIQVAFFEYDAQGRAYKSHHGASQTGFIDYTELTFNSGQSTVITDSFGLARTFDYSINKGVYRTNASSSIKCLHCIGSMKQTIMDAQTGYPDIQTDFKGTATDFDYNERGLEIRRQEGMVWQGQSLVETQWSRVIETYWHPVFNLESCIVEPQKTIDYVYDDIKGHLITRTEIDTRNFAITESKHCNDIKARADFATLNKRQWIYTYYVAGEHSGLLETVDGPRTDVQDVTHYYYHTGSANIERMVNAEGHQYNYLTYNHFGKPLIARDPNGLIVRRTYDERGRIRSERRGNSTLANDLAAYEDIVQYDYNYAGNLEKTTNTDGSFTRYVYDSAQRITDIYNQLGDHIKYTLDNLGNKTKVEFFDTQGVLKRTHSNQYSSENLLEYSRGADQPPQTTHYSLYDGEGNLKIVQDPESKMISYDYDALGRIWKSYDPKNGVDNPTVYLYNPQGYLVNVQDPRGNSTIYTYDGLGNKLTESSPDSGFVEYQEHDGAGNAHLKLGPLLFDPNEDDPNNPLEPVPTRYSFDGLNRLTHVAYNDNSTEAYIYDVGGVNKIGRLHSIEDKTGQTIYEYDLQGRVQSKNITIDGLNFSVGYVYLSGRVSSMTYPSGKIISYDFLNGQKNKVRIDQQTILKDIKYDPFGPLTQWNWGNNMLETRPYDLDGQLIRFKKGTALRELKYYPSGNIEKISDVGTGQNAINLTYDDLYQIKDFLRNSESQSFIYDGVGNRLTITLNGIPYTYDIELISNRLNAVAGLISKTYMYDTGGNVVQDGIHSYGYDARERLVNIDSGNTTYQINALGQRVSKYSPPTTIRPGDANRDTLIDGRDIPEIIIRILHPELNPGLDPGANCNNDSAINVLDLICVRNIVQNGDQVLANTKTYFVYDEKGQLIGEYDTKGQPIREHVWSDGMPVSVINNNTPYYVLTDHLGTPRTVLNQANVVVWQWDSDAFGNGLPSVDPDGDGIVFQYPLRFPGQYYDNETGLHYNYYRTYDPSTGRYLESDPIGLAGGINVYGYVGGNPVIRIDSSGLLFDGSSHEQTIKPEITYSNAKRLRWGLVGVGIFVSEIILEGYQSDESIFENNPELEHLSPANDGECKGPDDPCKRMLRNLKGLWLGIRDEANRNLAKSLLRKLADNYNLEREKYLRMCPGQASPPPMNGFNVFEE